MHWITEISINNYRAFKGQYSPIKIPYGQHLLIYGENGSGKSSIYNAVKDFFQSSVNSSLQFELNYFEKIAGNTTGEIKIEITEKNAAGVLQNPVQYVFAEPNAGSNNRIQLIQLANKLKGFLDYKRLLKTHFVNASAGQNPNLFDLVVEDILSDHLINSVQGGVGSVELQQEWGKFKYNIYRLDGRYSDNKQAYTDLPAFETNLRSLLTPIFAIFKNYVRDYFNLKLDIDVTLSQMKANAYGITQKLQLEIKYGNQQISSYQTFLNEARLSALGICLYLAGLKTYPQATDLKILYLDDVFIGLDTNNRIPLLKLIKSEFIHNGYQIFISTYDRQWFETARSWFNNENIPTKQIEMYVEDDGNPLTPDLPILIDPSENEFQKAQKYFKAKDYPTSANLLRKSCEKELRRILPENLRLIPKQNGIIIEIKELEKLVNNFESYIQKNFISRVPFQHIKTYKKIIFNPLSHDDLEAPHYRSEISDGILLIENLKKIKTKEIIKTIDSYKTPLKLAIVDLLSNQTHNYEITLLENLQIIQEDNNPIKLSIIECSVNESNAIRNFISINSALDVIWAERNQTTAINYSQLYSQLFMGNQSLQGKMQF